MNSGLGAGGPDMADKKSKVIDLSDKLAEPLGPRDKKKRKKKANEKR